MATIRVATIMMLASIFKNKVYIALFISLNFVVFSFLFIQKGWSDGFWFFITGFLMHIVMCIGLVRGFKTLIILSPLPIPNDDSDDSIFCLFIASLAHFFLLIIGVLGTLKYG